MFPCLNATDAGKGFSNNQAVASGALVLDPCGGGCLTPWDVQSKRVYSKDGTAPTLQAGGGTNIQPIVLDRTDTWT